MNPLGPDESAQIGAVVQQQHGDPGPGAQALAEWLGLPYRAGVGAGHHLASVEHDRPVRRPLRTLVIAATYRSGSTVLAESLFSAGGHGCPIEYFQSEQRFTRFAGPQFRSTVMSHRTDPDGTFGVKLFPPDSGAAEPLAGLPDPAVVRVTRKDRVAAATSTLRALQTGRWRSTDPPTAGTPTYDGQRLWQLVGMFENHHRFWDDRLGAHRVAVQVDHDELRSDLTGTVARVLKGLADVGRPSHQKAQPVRLVPMSPMRDDPWAARFAAEYRAGRFAGAGV
jgi:trehalose 2-sulfotransferase